MSNHLSGIQLRTNVDVKQNGSYVYKWDALQYSYGPKHSHVYEAKIQEEKNTYNSLNLSTLIPLSKHWIALITLIDIVTYKSKSNTCTPACHAMASNESAQNSCLGFLLLCAVCLLISVAFFFFFFGFECVSLQRLRQIFLFYMIVLWQQQHDLFLHCPIKLQTRKIFSFFNQRKEKRRKTESHSFIRVKHCRMCICAFCVESLSVTICAIDCRWFAIVSKTLSLVYWRQTLEFNIKFNRNSFNFQSINARTVFMQCQN